MRDNVLIPPQNASQFGQSFRKRQALCLLTVGFIYEWKMGALEWD
jgi:hypothetical protein